jgi:vesicle-associated membrane protein 4
LLDSDNDNNDNIDIESQRTRSNKNDSKISKLKNQVNDVIDDMKLNIEKVVDRGSNLDDLNDRSSQLGASADLFSKRSKSLRKTMWIRTCRSRMYLAITITVLLFLFLCKLIFISNLNLIKIGLNY